MTPSQLLAAAVLTGALCAAHAGSDVQVGRQLTPEQQKSLGFSTVYSVGGKTVKVAPATASITKSASAAPSTLVVNEQGVVGVSSNEVLVSQLPTATVRSQGAALVAAASSVTYYDHLQITSLRYARFADAVAAQEKLKAALPKAQVSLPIAYQQRKPR